MKQPHLWPGVGARPWAAELWTDLSPSVHNPYLSKELDHTGNLLLHPPHVTSIF